ncbi:MAG: hypothetical protein OXT67_00630 [Zetaproteobacteria bacterium]|nr:hypothetical protein [Zetaproteobacteria bacterium]
MSVQDTQTASASPTSWDKLQGYTQTFHNMSAAFHANRLPPVLLGVGSQGIGKATFLRQCAALYLCHQNQACGSCPACLQVKHNQHNDLLTLSPTDGRYRVEHAQEVMEHLQHHPQTHGGKPGYRVVLAPDLESATIPFFNKLLKTLEEPPSHAVILMSTAREQDILPTVRSRVLTWRIPKFSKALTAEIIRNHHASQNISIPHAHDIEDYIHEYGCRPGVILKHIQQSQETSQRLQAEKAQLEKVVDAQTPLPQALVAIDAWSTSSKTRFIDVDIIRQIERAIQVVYHRQAGKSTQNILGFQSSVLQQRRDFLGELYKAVLNQQISIQAKPALIRLAFVSREQEQN